MSNIQYMGQIPKKPVNPEAAKLANFYVPLILAHMGRSPKSATLELEKLAMTPLQAHMSKSYDFMIAAQNADRERRNLAENGYQPDALYSHDLEALVELPI